MSGEVVDFRKCIICGKKCPESDKNTDGTYAHADCLRQHMLRLIQTHKEEQ